jgi:hypothetical protein
MHKALTRAGLGAALALLFLLAPLPASAQTDALPAAPQRLVPIPPQARHAEMTFDGTPFVLVNNKYAAQLAPGARIFGPDNMLYMSGALSGTVKVKFLQEPATGLLMRVWILTSDEIASEQWSSPPPPPPLGK